jgi:hypothetical protein
VDIAGPILHRLGQQAIDKPDNRRRIIGFEQIGGLMGELVGYLVEAFTTR